MDSVPAFRDDAGHRRTGWIRLAAEGALVALAAVGVGYGVVSHSAPSRPVSPTARRSSSAASSGLLLATACPTPVSPGNSCVMTTSPGSPVILRACDGRPTGARATDTCGVVDYLRDGTQVTMRCWMVPRPPEADSHSSEQWLYVNEANGPHPGYSGYVAAALVAEQVSVPVCTPQILGLYQDPKEQSLPPLPFRVIGSCTSAEGTLGAVSSGFTPGGQFSVSATYPSGLPYPLTYTTGTVRPDGSVGWRWPCAGDPPGTYHTELVDLSDGNNTGDVPFSIGIPPSGGSPSPSLRPSSSSPPHVRPLDADATPAFGTCPSSPPPYDERNCGGSSSRCASASIAQNCPVAVSQGTRFGPVCWTEGQTVYNSYSAVAPGPKWTLKSVIWIKVKVTGHRSDPWMNELWFKPDNTASDGLPSC
jgi:hypothetical protein